MFLGLDLGTTNVKAVVTSPEGRVVAESSVPIPRYCTPDGGVEQDLDEIFTATCDALRQAAARAPAGQILAMGVSSQGGALQLLDSDGRPLGRVISWLDGRGRPFDNQLVNQVGTDWLVDHLGCNLSTMTLGQLLRLRHTQPEVFARARSIAFVGDAIVGRLCGRRAHDATSLSIALLYNPWQGRADDEMLRRLDIRDRQLPDLLAATSAAGGLLSDVASRTGLRAGIPVSPAVHDQYAASTGAGSVGPSDVCLGTGTAWVLVANSPRLSRPATSATFVCPHPVPDRFGHLLSMTNGGSTVDWLSGLLGPDRWPLDRLDHALAAVPAGSDGLTFWPLVSPGSSSLPRGLPGGRIEGIGLAHRPEHLLRAGVEGLACELARHLDLLARAGLPARRLVMCGAAAASLVTPQILADVTGCQVSCIAVSAISAFGAAVIARAMVEPQPDLAALARNLAPESRSVEPAANVPVYGELLARYLEAFRP